MFVEISPAEVASLHPHVTTLKVVTQVDSTRSRDAVPSEAPEPLPLYAPFGKFQLLASLGKGGMGEVFLAVASGFKGVNKLVVVKRLRESISEDPQMRALFLEEGRLATRLNHPNVVQTIEVGEESGALYLGMEYLEGQSLYELRRKLGEKKIERHVVARIISDALSGLQYAHELCDYDGTPLNIVHRDLSPHNIFITFDGVVKVLDFGIAKAAVQANHTDAGVLKGKVAYMSPEQVVADSVDRRADLFVVGIVFWELLTGQRLFAGESMPKTFHRLLKVPIPRVSSVVPDIEPALDEIVAHALEKNPDKRYASAQHMRDALEAYMARAGKLVRPEDLGQLMSKLFARRREQVRRQVRLYMTAVDAAGSTTDLPRLAPRREADTGAGSALTAMSAGRLASVSRFLDKSRRKTSELSLAALLFTTVAAGSLYAGYRTRPQPSLTRMPDAPSTLNALPVPEAVNPTSAVAAEIATTPADDAPKIPIPSAAPTKPQQQRTSTVEAHPSARAQNEPHPATTATTTAPSSPPTSQASDTSPPPAATIAKRKFRTTF